MPIRLIQALINNFSLRIRKWSKLSMNYLRKSQCPFRMCNQRLLGWHSEATCILMMIVYSRKTWYLSKIKMRRRVKIMMTPQTYKECLLVCQEIAYQSLTQLLKVLNAALKETHKSFCHLKLWRLVTEVKSSTWTFPTAYLSLHWTQSNSTKPMKTRKLMKKLFQRHTLVRPTIKVRWVPLCIQQEWIVKGHLS
jgi:hypothetical protein